MVSKDKLPKEEEQVVMKEYNDRIGQTQFYDIITSRKPDWQTIIYDLIHSEQLDPWDIDLVKLTTKYFERIEEMEEDDFYLSSKVLLAAALLLRIKSEFLLNKHLRSIDELLFGKKEDSKNVVERIIVNEDELPILVPKTPLPRSKRVTLPELMIALGKAINTESRRIKREVNTRRAQKMSEIDFPKFRKIDLKDRIKMFYARVLTSIRKKSGEPHKNLNKVSYKDMVGTEREEKLAHFLPLLLLSNQKKLWLEQDGHLEEIWIFLHEYFKKNREKFVDELEEDIESMKEELEEETGLKISDEEKEGMAEELEKELEWSVDEKIVGETSEGDEKTVALDLLKKEKEKVEKVKKEIEKEEEKIEKDEKIDKATGFSDEQF